MDDRRAASGSVAVASPEVSTDGPAAQARRPRHWRRGGSTAQSYLLVIAFAAPALAFMAVFLVYPTIQSVNYSFYNWNGLTPGHWVGLANYRELFGDQFFRAVIKHSLIIAVLGTFGTMTIGLLWAYGIERRLPGWRAYRFLLFIPVVMPATVSALLWGILLDAFGPVNQGLTKLGWKDPPDWLGDYHYAIWVVVFVSIWQASGFTMLIILGAMEDVPSELHDAASLDGASSVRRLRSIVVPYIRGTLGTLAIVQFIGLLKAFDIVFALTKGGPGNSTDILGTYLLEKAFRESRYGYGSAVAVSMTVIMFTISFIFYRRLLGKDATS